MLSLPGRLPALLYLAAPPRPTPPLRPGPLPTRARLARPDPFSCSLCPSHWARDPLGLSCPVLCLRVDFPCWAHACGYLALPAASPPPTCLTFALPCPQRKETLPLSFQGVFSAQGTGPCWHATPPIILPESEWLWAAAGPVSLSLPQAPCRHVLLGLPRRLPCPVPVSPRPCPFPGLMAGLGAATRPVASPCTSSCHCCPHGPPPSTEHQAAGSARP